jgi:hypothetical protein
MKKPKIIEPSMEMLDKLVIKEIIYAEHTPLGAMGNEGGVMFYIIKNDNLICHESNIDKDENIYNKMVDILESSFERDANNIFDLYDGRVGNEIFINKKMPLKVADEHFIYTKNEKDYCIYSSCEGVFKNVASQLSVEMYRKWLRKKGFPNVFEKWFLEKKLIREEGEWAIHKDLVKWLSEKGFEKGFWIWLEEAGLDEWLEVWLMKGGIDKLRKAWVDNWLKEEGFGKLLKNHDKK